MLQPAALGEYVARDRERAAIEHGQRFRRGHPRHQRTVERSPLRGSSVHQAQTERRGDEQGGEGEGVNSHAINDSMRRANRNSREFSTSQAI